MPVCSTAHRGARMQREPIFAARRRDRKTSI